jgi:group I intron endonuclease
MVGIYKITNPKGKVYIGLSKNIEQRWKSYSWKNKSNKQQTKLWFSLKKYGIEKHKFEVLEECSIEELIDKEIYYIEKYNSINEGLNVSRGGYYFHEVNKGKKHSKETIQKMNKWWEENSKPRSQETIQKITQTKKNNPRVTTDEMIQNYRKTAPNKKSISQYDLENTHINDFESINEAARSTNIGKDSISACCRNKQKTAGGFIWKYKEN